VNAYGITGILALCFHMEEKAENFSFALESYIKSGFSIPEVIYTDLSKVLMKAVQDQWLTNYKSMKNFLCV